MKTALAFLVAFPIYTFAAPAAAPAGQPVKEEITLNNGLRVILWEDHAYPIAVVNIRYNVGSSDELTGGTGRAHLFEHYMFRHHSRDLEGEDYWSQAGALGAEINANTSQDRTDYYDIAPSEALDRIFQMEAARMLSIGDSVNPVDLANELKAVHNEKFQRESAPYAKVYYLYLCNLVFGLGHPYEHPIIGTFQDIDSMSAPDAKAFFSKYYRPSNAVMAVVGDFDRAEAKKLLRQWFDPVPNGLLPDRPQFPAERAPGRRELTISDPNAFKTKVFLAYRVPPQGQPGSLELSVLSSILASGRGSRLVDELQVKRRLVTEISASPYGLEKQDIFLVEATPADGVTPKQVEAAVGEVLAEVARGGVSDDEMRRTTARVQTGRVLALQDAEKLAADLVDNLAVRGDALSSQADLDAISRMPPAAPQAAAARYLRPDNLSVLIVVPGGAQ